LLTALHKLRHCLQNEVQLVMCQPRITNNMTSLTLIPHPTCLQQLANDEVGFGEEKAIIPLQQG
jgi:hypothetical protein